MMRLFIMLGTLLASTGALAHKPSDSYLTFNADAKTLTGQWDIALRDLDYAIGLDINDDGDITWAELRVRKQAIQAYAFTRLQLSANQQRCSITPGDLLVDEHSDGHYAVLLFQASCPTQAKQFALVYSLFFDFDSQHRGLLTLATGGRTATHIFSPEQDHYGFKRDAEVSPWQSMLNFAHEGVWHIWIGFDHILFLLSLLLPSALIREHSSWRLKTGCASIFKDVLAVVTSFTLAHSITLSLTALHVIALPARWVESAIAASVVLAALNNIYPFLANHRAWFAFGFGLIHGMGIAGVLLDMGLPDNQRFISLLGFNLGVEAGQLAVVALALPAIACLSRQPSYPARIMKLGSAGIAMIAAFWFLQRALDLPLNILELL